MRAYESAEDKLELLRASVAAPLIVVGLDADEDWPDVSPVFPGTGKGGGKGGHSSLSGAIRQAPGRLAQPSP